MRLRDDTYYAGRSARTRLDRAYDTYYAGRSGATGLARLFFCDTYYAGRSGEDAAGMRRMTPSSMAVNNGLRHLPKWIQTA